MLNTYNTMIPLYMKEDPKFSRVYKYIESVFQQVIDTCEDIKNNMSFSDESIVFLKVLSLFGQNNKFKGEVYRVVGLYYDSSTSKWTVMRTSTKVNTVILLSDFALYFTSKFNTLKNNLNGTFKNLKESLEKIFTYSNSYMTIECFQDRIQDETDDHNLHQSLTLSVSLSTQLSADGVFPPQEAWLDEHGDPTGTLWDIRDINMDWVTASEENTKMYNFYSNFLDLITLLENKYFNLNVLGALTTFEINENAPVLRWGKSKWNQSSWSNTFVEEE